MRRAVLALTVAASLSLGAHLRADDLVYARFGAYLDALRSQGGIPGLAAIVVGLSDVIWQGGFGQQNAERGIAAAPDTPFEVDGLTQLFTTVEVLRCVEEGRLSLDDPVSQYGGPADGSTIRQVLSHTSSGPSGLVFAYRLDRLGPLANAVSACRGDSFRAETAKLLDQLAMVNSVPGPDVLGLVPPASDGLSTDDVQRYGTVLGRLAIPYSVGASSRTPSAYTATTLTPSAGLISTAWDLAQFDLALKRGWLQSGTLGTAWTAPVGANGQRLPHGLGWFVQSYNGEAIVWQFGEGDGASSSLILTVPGRGLTLILLANSDGLSRPFALGGGDVTTSPFARLFLGLFLR